MCLSHRPAPSCCSRCSASDMSVVQPSSPRTCRSTNGPACLVHRTYQNAAIRDWVVSHVTITDPHHFLFGQRLALIREPSGRGSAYVVIALADGRRRSVRVATTDLAPPDHSPGANARTLPRISIRTLARHLNRILNLLTEEVI